MYEVEKIPACASEHPERSHSRQQPVPCQVGWIPNTCMTAHGNRNGIWQMPRTGWQSTSRTKTRQNHESSNLMIDIHSTGHGLQNINDQTCASSSWTSTVAHTAMHDHASISLALLSNLFLQSKQSYFDSVGECSSMLLTGFISRVTSGLTLDMSLPSFKS